ncbi:DUF6998 domain-containing protein [Henriciella pelagia]|jgi:hypothetical protein|uniref:DUF6998 domain-containing protein n=1 Tax=Henriciella pelagia TaxID=1977912 RepID=A0ABQ1JFZ9_9PROT|nr:hypothetical protein [Henriciella pelagia]GGB67495.1 hypothetical protein GCM10011503_15370 [Henriciella pelagia]
MTAFALPEPIRHLVLARNGLRDHYQVMLNKAESGAALNFTLDGNLVGDIGEAIAVELFGVKLVTAKSVAGIDGYAPDGKTTVQVKVTGTGRGPAFRQTETRADHLLFFDLDFENLTGTVVFNGPEHFAISKLPDIFSGQRSLTARQIRQADELVPAEKRLPLVSEV